MPLRYSTELFFTSDAGITDKDNHAVIRTPGALGIRGDSPSSPDVAGIWQPAQD